MNLKEQNQRNSSCPTEEELSTCLQSCHVSHERVHDHLSSCKCCQQTLISLAGEQTWWEHAESYLSTDPDPSADRIARSVCALSGDVLPTDADGDPQLQVNQEELRVHELKQLQSLLEPASHPELLGRIGRYELEQLVGRGGMGLVFRGHDTDLHRVVAIKTIAAHLQPVGAARERFVREARASASLSHPHIVAVYDVITDGAVPAIVMQFIAGETLEDRLKEHGPMTWQSVLQLGIQLCDALSAAHDCGLIHRDIKPGNVMLEAGASRALLTDFGLVRALDDATLTRTGSLTGTPDFMSPEQALGRSLDQRSDLFSLGSLLYTMLIGHPPFRAPEPMAILNRICNQKHPCIAASHSDIPLEVSRMIDRLLAKQPRKRFSTASEARDRMQELARSPLHLSTQSSRRKRMIRIGIGLAAMIATLAVAPRFIERLSSNHSSMSTRRHDSRPSGSAAFATPGYDLSSSSQSSGFVELKRLDAQIENIESATKAMERERASKSIESILYEPNDSEIEREMMRIRRAVGRIENELSTTD